MKYEIAPAPEPMQPVRMTPPQGGSGTAPSNPLAMIPADWREPVALLWTCNAHLLPSALALCARLRLYAERGLTADDVRWIVRILLEPERAATHKFAAELLADLAGLVAVRLRHRKRIADWYATRQAADPAPSNCPVPLADLFQAPDEH